MAARGSTTCWRLPVCCSGPATTMEKAHVAARPQVVPGAFSSTPLHVPGESTHNEYRVSLSIQRPDRHRQGKEIGPTAPAWREHSTSMM